MFWFLSPIMAYWPTRKLHILPIMQRAKAGEASWHNRKPKASCMPTQSNAFQNCMQLQEVLSLYPLRRKHFQTVSLSFSCQSPAVKTWPAKLQLKPGHSRLLRIGHSWWDDMNAKGLRPSNPKLSGTFTGNHSILLDGFLSFPQRFFEPKMLDEILGP